MQIGWIGFGLATASVLAVMVSCGVINANAPPIREVDGSVAGIESLLEGECFEWRSFDWARNEYLRDRASCIGEISPRSIQDCHANVTDTEWSVEATNSSAAFGVTYFFDEVSEPMLDDTSCNITVPPELAREGYAAARLVASRHRLKGPFRSGEHGFSTPTLREYWVDRRNVPVLGLLDGRSGTDRTGIHLIRYPNIMAASHADQGERATLPATN
jgi:hypothetical protein